MSRRVQFPKKCFEHPHLGDLDVLAVRPSLGTPGSLGLGISGILWGWARQGVSRVGRSREFLGLGIGRSLWGWALHGVSGRGWAFQGVFGVHTTSEVSGVGHTREFLGVDRARRRVPGEEKSLVSVWGVEGSMVAPQEEFSVRFNNLTPKVGNNDTRNSPSPS